MIAVSCLVVSLAFCFFLQVGAHLEGSHDVARLVLAGSHHQLLDQRLLPIYRLAALCVGYLLERPAYWKHMSACLSNQTDASMVSHIGSDAPRWGLLS